MRRGNALKALSARREKYGDGLDVVSGAVGGLRQGMEM